LTLGAVAMGAQTAMVYMERCEVPKPYTLNPEPYTLHPTP